MQDITVKYPLGDDPPSARLLYGQDALVSLRTLPDRSVHMVATSPPYFGLRDYNCEGQIGLEDTPEAYVARLVEVFQEVHRVLRDDGVLWLNLGDSYSTPTKGVGGDKGFSAGGKKRTNNRTQPKMETPRRTAYGGGIKSKDLIGIPWMVAFALRSAGWYLRQDIIWAKPNPMPSSVRDRCTTAHEYIFLLTKSERYFFDADAIREPLVSDYSKDALSKVGSGKRGRPKGDNFSKQQRHAEGTKTPRTRAERALLLNPEGRNKRSVWTITTKPYSGAHFATWPTDLVELLILSGSGGGGCCAVCATPWQRKTKDTWGSACACEAPAVPCMVLDPFSGSATTGAVAMQHRRNYIGLDINEDYLGLAHARLENRRPPVTETPEDNVLDLFQ